MFFGFANFKQPLSDLQFQEIGSGVQNAQGLKKAMQLAEGHYNCYSVAGGIKARACKLMS